MEIVSAREATQSHNIDLSGNKIGDQGVSDLAKHLKEATQSHTIYLDDNNIGAQGASDLAKHLKEATQSHTISLDDNNIGDQGASDLAKHLKEATQSHTIYLDDNNIGDQGASDLANHLKEATQSHTINLYGNNIGDQGLKDLESMIKNSPFSSCILGLPCLNEAMQCNDAILAIRKTGEFKVMIKEEFNTILPIPELKSLYSNDCLKKIIIQYIGGQEANHINLQYLQDKSIADWGQSLEIESPGRFNYFWPIKKPFDTKSLSNIEKYREDIIIDYWCNNLIKKIANNNGIAIIDSNDMAAYRTLARVLHPDKGGDENQMVLLNKVKHIRENGFQDYADRKEAYESFYNFEFWSKAILWIKATDTALDIIECYEDHSQANVVKSILSTSYLLSRLDVEYIKYAPTYTLYASYLIAPAEIAWEVYNENYKGAGLKAGIAAVGYGLLSLSTPYPAITASIMKVCTVISAITSGLYVAQKVYSKTIETYENVTLDIKQDTDELNAQNEQVSHEDLQSIDGGSVNGNVKVVLEALKQKLADMPHGSAKLLNNELSCIVQGQEYEIFNNLLIMKHAQIYSLSSALTDEDRKVVNTYYQEKVSEIIAISASLTKMKVNTKLCDDDFFQKIKDLLNLEPDNLEEIQEELNLVKAAINNEFSNCNSNFEESVVATIANTNIASIQEAYNAGETLEDAVNSAVAGVMLTMEQNNLAFDNHDYCSESTEVSQHNEL